jgi:hypothetical protein
MHAFAANGPVLTPDTRGSLSALCADSASAGLELGLDELLTAARDSADESVRKGAAEICARRLVRTADPVGTAAALRQFFSDADDDVRQAAAQADAHCADRLCDRSPPCIPSSSAPRRSRRPCRSFC